MSTSHFPRPSRRSIAEQPCHTTRAPAVRTLFPLYGRRSAAHVAARKIARDAAHLGVATTATVAPGPRMAQRARLRVHARTRSLCRALVLIALAALSADTPATASHRHDSPVAPHAAGGHDAPAAPCSDRLQRGQRTRAWGNARRTDPAHAHGGLLLAPVTTAPIACPRLSAPPPVQHRARAAGARGGDEASRGSLGSWRTRSSRRAQRCGGRDASFAPACSTAAVPMRRRLAPDEAGRARDGGGWGERDRPRARPERPSHHTARCNCHAEHGAGLDAAGRFRNVAQSASGDAVSRRGRRGNSRAWDTEQSGVRGALGTRRTADVMMVSGESALPPLLDGRCGRPRGGA